MRTLKEITAEHVELVRLALTPKVPYGIRRELLGQAELLRWILGDEDTLASSAVIKITYDIQSDPERR